MVFKTKSKQSRERGRRLNSSLNESYVTDEVGRGIRGIFFRGAKSLFLIFSRREMLFFPLEISILVDPKQISAVSKKWKAKKKKKVLCFFSHHFPLQLTWFFYSSPSTIFLLFFFIFPFSLPLFSWLVSKNFLVKNIWEHSAPPPPPPLHHWK